MGQTQIGSDIDGEAAGDRFGSSVAISSDGSRVAIGARFNDGSADAAGHVRVYDWNGAAWVQVGADIDGEGMGDESGWSLAMSSDGSRVAIGAQFNDGSANDAGHVRVYDWNGAAWVQVGADIDGESADDRSGPVAISSDGSRVAIGAPFHSVHTGHVRVYDWNGAAWVQVGADIDGEAAIDQSGSSVALSSDGNRVAIGAPVNNSLAGHVRVYDWNGAAWVQVGADIDGEAAEDLSGNSVALSSDGSRVAIGARGNDGTGDLAGHVRVYDWNGAAWVQVGADIDGESADDRSGPVAISSDGSRVAIGARLNDGTADNAGHVRVYDWSGVAWVQRGMDIDGEAEGDQSGTSVALSSDGSRLAIGAEWNDVVAGHVRVYSLDALPSFADVTTTPLEGDATAAIAWGDYDDDGDPDLYFNNTVFLNLFEKPQLLRNDAGSFVEVTPSALDISASSFLAEGAAWADYDGDGRLDLLRSGSNQDTQLLRNLGGGDFESLEREGLTDFAGRGGAWADFDNDGDLDVYKAPEIGSDRFYRHMRTCGFTSSEVFLTSGVPATTEASRMAWGDYDNDGDLDLYVSAVNGLANHMLRNDGGTLVDVTSPPLTDIEYNRHAAWGDYDNDGDLDLFVARDSVGLFDSADRLLRNDGGGSFSEVVSAAINVSIGTNGIAWGDYDNDGDLDLYLDHTNAAANRLLRNDSGTFVDVTTANLEGAAGPGPVAWADYDGDGDLDLMVGNASAGPANRLLRNDTVTGNHWLHVDLEGRDSNTSAIGARVRVVAGGVTQIREVSGGIGLMQESFTAEFGLGSTAIIDSVVVQWPTGIVQVVSPVPSADTRITVVEQGQGFVDATSGALADGGDGVGMAWGDFDGDGAADLYAANVTSSNALLLNRGAPFVDATVAPIDDPAGSARGVAAADYDNDGDLDLYLANIGANFLYRNDDGTWVDVTAGPLGDANSGHGVSWADYDNDGDLDLFIANLSQDDRLLRNEGGSVFVDASGSLADSGPSLTGAWGDFDGDGDLDLYVCKSSLDRLHRNEGGGVFVDVTSAPLGSFEETRSAAWGDYDNDGDLDLYVAILGSANHLYRNEGGGVFVDATSGPLFDPFGGHSVAWGDYDNDGDLDLYLANFDTDNRLFRNEGGGAFVLAVSGPAADAGAGVGAAWEDIDFDGDLDLYVTNFGANKLIRNVNASGNHWLTVRLIGVESNRQGIGARVRVITGGTEQLREINAGSGYLSQSSASAHFGLGAATSIDSLVIEWPSGIVQSYAGFEEIDHCVTFRETSDAIVDVTGPAEPRALAFAGAQPNPFQSSTRLNFALPASGHVKLTIYDVQGRSVATLVNERLEAGRHALAWNGRGRDGHAASAGVYFARLAFSSDGTGYEILQRRVVLTR